jgi:hypothetical protein
MICGVVNLRREATLPLVVGNSSGQREVIDTVIDTGLQNQKQNPCLEWQCSALLNPAMKFVLGGALRAPPKTNFIATISNTAMLYSYRLQVDNVEGGIVKIEAL